MPVSCETLMRVVIAHHTHVVAAAVCVSQGPGPGEHQPVAYKPDGPAFSLYERLGPLAGKKKKSRKGAGPEPGQYFTALGPSGPAYSFANRWVGFWFLGGLLAGVLPAPGVLCEGAARRLGACLLCILKYVKAQLLAKLLGGQLLHIVIRHASGPPELANARTVLA